MEKNERIYTWGLVHVLRSFLAQPAWVQTSGLGNGWVIAKVERPLI